MFRHLFPVVAILLVPGLAPRLGAQQPGGSDSIQTPHGACRVWVGIPGGTSPEDRSHARCALDHAPVLLSERALPQPWTGSPMRGRFTVVVDARRVELGAWDFDVTYDPSIPPDSDVSIYLVAR